MSGINDAVCEKIFAGEEFSELGVSEITVGGFVLNWTGDELIIIVLPLLDLADATDFRGSGIIG